MTDEAKTYENIRVERKNIATLQQRAAADPQHSVWVEASAGTGKTKVLSDRVLRLLLSGVNPMKILCLTYTKAAAAQMKERVTKNLSAWAVMSESDLENELCLLLGKTTDFENKKEQYKSVARRLFAKLLDTPGGIKIQTIHSFCQEVLKRFPLEAGITPYFEVMDDGDANQMIGKIKQEILRQAALESQTEISHCLHYLTANLAQKDFSQIMETLVQRRGEVNEILAKYQNFAQFETALAAKIGADKTMTVENMIVNYMNSIDEVQIKAYIQAWRKGKKEDNARADAMEKILQNGLKANDFETYAQQFLTQEHKQKARLLSEKTKIEDPQVYENICNEAAKLEGFYKKIKLQRLFFASQAVFGIASELNERYEVAKRQSAKLDYGDLIKITCDLLSSKDTTAWVLYKLDGGIDHILIDEAQDTSPNQWKIIKSLSEEFFAAKPDGQRERTVFAVGDRKQSIFSFQGADPDKFDEMADYFAAKSSQNFSKISLEVSFRSSAAILDIVNKIFADENVSRGVTAPYEVVNHLPYRAGEFGKVEIWPLMVEPDKQTEKKDLSQIEEIPFERSTNISLKNKLAKKVVQKIKDLMAESKNTANPLHFRDFMVLVQKRANGVEDIVRACKEMDVNVSGADKLKLSEQIAVQDLISLGKFLLFTDDDLSLAEVLKSPLFGLNDDDLFDLCYNRGKASLWVKLGDNKNKYGNVYAQLQDLLNSIDFIRPYELYNLVLTKYNGRYKFIARMGLEVEDALDEFINTALNYEQSHIPSMQGFISWISTNEVEVKREGEQSDIDAVRLMTVHHSKGLQAKVVFLFDTLSNKSSIQYADLLNGGDIGYYPLNKDCYNDNCLKIREQKTQKNIEEYRRLMYVALTRAEDRLYICGFGKKQSTSAWYDLCEKVMENNGKPKDDYICYETPQIMPAKKNDNEELQNKLLPFEAWIYEQAKQESPLAKPYTPSKPFADEDDGVSPLTDEGNFYRRGTLIHKMLQFLHADTQDCEQAIKLYLEQNAQDFSEFQREKIFNQVIAVLQKDEFKEIFGPDSLAEVPIIGEVDGKIISAQIDRLVILPDVIKIIDFKTNKIVAENLAQVPPAYIKQLQTYAKLIAKIYPAQRIETYILWTNQAYLHKLSV